MKHRIPSIVSILTCACPLWSLVAVATAETGGTPWDVHQPVGWVAADSDRLDGSAAMDEERGSEIARRMASLEATVAQLMAQQRPPDVDFAAYRQPATLASQPAGGDKKPEKEEAKPKKWYEKYGIRGYTQFRFNDVIYLSDGSARPNHAGDESVSDDRTFLIRRAHAFFSPATCRTTCRSISSPTSR